ncbi:MAG: hypothetical protein H6733_16855 [Alphaproteobacteria bacterium]|nr:hypothetical protein [Alphaproteobacteria bacterium]
MRPLLLIPLALAACTPSTSDPDPVVDTCLDADRLQTADGTVSCADQGRWCDAATAACVDPWRLGSPTFAACDTGSDNLLATKAATYQERADHLHVHPDLGWMMGVELPAEADPATATWEDVVTWQRGANDGLWSSLYLASQAFRAASTTGTEHDAAVQTVRAMLVAERERMDVSGVQGNLVRTYVKPGIDGLACPADDAEYRADVEKDDDRWMRVREDGCLTWLPTEGDAWVVSDVCPGTDFAGWCFRDNTSKDEYAGHMFALGAVLKLVDDPTSVDLARELVRDVVVSLLDHDLTMYDPDGRRTEHGDFSPALGLGFNAAFSLAFFTIGDAVLDDPRVSLAKQCFTGERTGDDCPTFEPGVDLPFTSVLHLNAVHLDANDCLANDNNASMFLLSLVDLLWWETDPTLRATYQATLTDIWTADNLRALGLRENAWYDLFWAAFKDLGPAGDGPAFDAVSEAACGLTAFPVDEVRREVPPSTEPQLCLDRLDRPMGAVPRGPDERCLEAFVWWKDQYVLRGCAAEPTIVEPPADYLLPYWMGRYFGFFDPTW